jgi:hypothetical protein
MADGYTGLLAPWIGGAADAPATTTAGVRSLLAPWIGGAGVTPGATSIGFTGLLAFWAGGAANGGATTQTGGYVARRTLDIERDDEEVLLAVATLLMSMR